MLILLPPSETKRVGGEGVLQPGALHGHQHEEMRLVRRRVREALEELSRGDEEAAAKALKLGVKNRSELQHNLRLHESGVMPAIERYTGVLYDALDVASLDEAAREWLSEHVLVQSALLGLVGAGDPIPAYRLSAGSRLPALGAPLKRLWAQAHARLEWNRAGFVLDLRSKDYVALAPLPSGAGFFLQVVQRGADGEVRALNHFNKAAKGDLVRRLARSGADIDSADELLAWAADEDLEMSLDASSGTVTLVTELGAPAPGSSAATGAR